MHRIRTCQSLSEQERGLKFFLQKLYNYSVAKKRKVTLIFKGSISEMDHDEIYRQSFGKLSPRQKLEETWKMVQDVWYLKGVSSDELRFNRTVAVIKHQRC